MAGQPTGYVICKSRVFGSAFYLHTYIPVYVCHAGWVAAVLLVPPASQPSWQSDDKDDEEEEEDGAAGEQGRRVINPVR